MGRCDDKRHPHSSSFLLSQHLFFTIRPSTLCLLLVLLSLSNQQRRRTPPPPPSPQSRSTPPPTTPRANHSLRNWLFARFQSRKTRLAVSTTKVWLKTQTLHLQVSFTMSLKAAIFTPATSQIPATGNGATRTAPKSPSTYSITPTIRMSLELTAEGTPSTPSPSTLVGTPTTTPPCPRLNGGSSEGGPLRSS